MANRNSTFLLKRSNVSGKVPALSGLTIGELALNVADSKLYSLYTGGLTGATEVREIGWDRLSISGGTLTGDLNITGSLTATTISGGTFYGNGSNLIGIISGGSFSGSTLILNRNGSSNITITGFTNGGSVSGDYLPISGGTIKGNLTITGTTTLNSTTATTLYTNYIDFNTNATTTTQFGRLNWDSGTGTLNIGIGDSTTGLVDFQVGQEEVVRVYNNEATTLTAGTIVYVSGSQGNRPAVKRALATSDGYSVTTLGMVDVSIPSGSEGYVTTFGMINNLNTLGLTGGTPIWLSPTIPGGYTATKPKAPDHTVLLGYVVRIHATVGSIFVNISNGWEIDELHDVRLNGRTHGDLLIYSGYNGYNLWTNSKTLNGTYTINGGLTITGTTSGGTFYGSGIGITNIPISGVTNLQTELDKKFDKSGGTISGDVTINGNLIINGTATTINTETILVKDNIITLNSNYSGNTSPFNGSSGIEVLRGSGTTSTLLWDESNNYWVAGLSGSTKRVILSGDSLSLLTSGHTHTISDITNLPIYSSSINDKSGVVTATTIGNDFNTGIKISQTPRGYVDVSVNGLSVSVGDGVTTSDCYFSSNGTSGGVRYFTGITSNDFFMWNTTISGYELDSGDTISFYYIIQN